MFYIIANKADEKFQLNLVMIAQYRRGDAVTDLGQDMEHEWWPV